MPDVPKHIKAKRNNIAKALAVGKLRKGYLENVDQQIPPVWGDEAQQMIRDIYALLLQSFFRDKAEDMPAPEGVSLAEMNQEMVKKERAWALTFQNAYYEVRQYYDWRAIANHHNAKRFLTNLVTHEFTHVCISSPLPSAEHPHREHVSLSTHDLAHWQEWIVASEDLFRGDLNILPECDLPILTQFQQNYKKSQNK